MTQPMSSRKFWLLAALACTALVILTRLPALLGPHLIPDGDEAVLGLMARELVAGDSLPLFFSGQRYGLSIVETASAALAFGVFGSSTLALKAAMLPLFIIGTLLHASAARRFSGTTAAVVVLLLLSVAPAWGGFALKARGGYLTAYLFSGLVLHVASKGLREEGQASPVPLGLSLGAVLAVQPLWALPLLLWVALRAWPLAWSGRVIFAACAAALPLASLALASLLDVEGLDWSPSLANRALGPALLLEWPRDVWEASTGAFYLRDVSTRGVLAVTGGLWGLACVFAWIASALAILRVDITSGSSRQSNHAMGLLAIGALAATAIALPTDTPRYLLPALSIGVLLFGITLAPALARRSGLALSAVAGLILSALPALTGLREMPLAGGVEARVDSESAALASLIEALDERGIEHVYCEHNLLQWIVMFESEERIRARWHPAVDRIPAHPIVVDMAAAAGEPVAWIGYREQASGVESHYQKLGSEPPVIEFIAGRYFLIAEPLDPVLRNAGFELAPVVD